MIIFTPNPAASADAHPAFNLDLQDFAARAIAAAGSGATPQRVREEAVKRGAKPDRVFGPRGLIKTRNSEGVQVITLEEDFETFESAADAMVERGGGFVEWWDSDNRPIYIWVE